MKSDKKDILEKVSWKPGNVLAPVPVVLVSCGKQELKNENIITVAWVGTICSDPPMVSIAIRPERYSYEIIQETREFVINLPSLRHVRQTDWCGVVSGRTVDKFQECKFTKQKALQIESPLIAECPVNIECRVSHSIPLGTHEIFLAHVVAVQVSSHFIDEKGRFGLDRCKLFAYGLGHYYSLGDMVDSFGFSVRKKDKTKRKKR